MTGRDVEVAQNVRDVIRPRQLSHDLDAYWKAVADRDNPDMTSLGYQWADKPHRLLHDLIAYALHLESVAATSRASGYRQGVEDAAGVARAEPEPEGPIPNELALCAPEDLVTASVRATKDSIATAILALAPDGPGAGGWPSVGQYARVPGLAYGDVPFVILGIDGDKAWLKEEKHGWSYVEGVKNLVQSAPPTPEPAAKKETGRCSQS